MTIIITPYLDDLKDDVIQSQGQNPRVVLLASFLIQAWACAYTMIETTMVKSTPVTNASAGPVLPNCDDINKQ